MKDQRIRKIKQHFDLFLNNQKFKVLSCKIDEDNHTLSIKTKIWGQKFPHNGHFVFSIPSKNITRNLCISCHSSGKGDSIEEWHYTITNE